MQLSSIHMFTTVVTTQNRNIHDVRWKMLPFEKTLKLRLREIRRYTSNLELQDSLASNIRMFYCSPQAHYSHVPANNQANVTILAVIIKAIKTSMDAKKYT